MARVDTALSMMKMALALLDALDESAAAAHLQHAISAASREAVPSTIEDMEAALDTPSARAVLKRME
ncbi:hypothetical protein [Sphingomonas bacterium]|uniref:hypothetical protein n=1 Tax=Sphingomonas bacterium TaxID=1895847 RepID=UPI001575A07C|nr:hypothetical protein [Sphingomonas bacterium]